MSTRSSSLFRKSSRALRLALAGMALIFVLDVLASGLHQHQPDSDACHSSSTCNYCLTFTGLMDAPVTAPAPVRVAALSAPLTFAAPFHLPQRLQTSAQARAPPAR